MSETVSLESVLQSATVTSSLSGHSMLCADSSGGLKKTSNLLLLHPNFFQAVFIPNIDEALTPGLYQINTSTIGTFPGEKSAWAYCLLEVIRVGDIVQRLTCYTTGATAVRYYNVGAGAFRAWYQTRI